jgi:hypothetical protein
MKILASALGIIGAGCLIMGIVLSLEFERVRTALDNMPDPYTPMFWLVIASVLLLGAIASAVVGMSKER